MFLPAVILIVLGYALFYTGAAGLSDGVFTGGNRQGLATSLGLDKLTAKPSSGPVTTAGSTTPDTGGTVTPVNGAGTVAA